MGVAWVVPLELPGGQRGWGTGQASLPLLQSRVWTKGHVIHRGPPVNPHGHHQGPQPRAAGCMPASSGTARDRAAEHTAQLLPWAAGALTVGSRGCVDGRKQMTLHSQVMGDAHPVPHLRASALPLLKRRPCFSPRPPAAAPQTHTGAWKDGAGPSCCSGHCQGTGWAKNSLHPPPAPGSQQWVTLPAGSLGQLVDSISAPGRQQRLPALRTTERLGSRRVSAFLRWTLRGHVGMGPPRQDGARGGASFKPGQRPPNPWRLRATPAHQALRAQACFWLLPGLPLPGTRLRLSV